MIKTIILCLMSFFTGYYTAFFFFVRYIAKGHKYKKTDKQERMLQLFILAVFIAVVITLSMI